MIPEQETYQQQLARMRDAAVTRATKAEAELRAAEDELAQWRQRASREAEYRERAERAEARNAAVRALATKAVTGGSSWDGNEPALGEEILEALAEARP